MKAMEKTRDWYKKNRANFITIAGLIASSWLLFEIIFNPKKLKKITILYLLSGISDFLDGKVARWLKIESPFGSIADQFRDKVLFCPSQIILVFFQYREKFHPSFLALMFISAMLELLTFIGGVIGVFWNIKGVRKIETDSSKFGQKKTFAGFIVGLLIIMYLHNFSPIINIPAMMLAYFGLVLMIYWGLNSLAEYKSRAWPDNNKAQ